MEREEEEARQWEEEAREREEEEAQDWENRLSRVEDRTRDLEQRLDFYDALIDWGEGVLLVACLLLIAWMLLS